MGEPFLELEHVHCSFCIFFIIFILLLAKSSTTQEMCYSQDTYYVRGPLEIQFPFWNRDENSSMGMGMGYPPGFGLTRIRTPQNHTRLQLDSLLPAKMWVEGIDYDYRLISLVAADGCYRQQLLHLNLSAVSPFGITIPNYAGEYAVDYYPTDDECFRYYYYGGSEYPDDSPPTTMPLKNITLFSCPASNYSRTCSSNHIIHCAGDRDHKVYALPSGSLLGDYDLRNCKKAAAATLDGPVYDLLFPQPRRRSARAQTPHTCRLQLTWSVPACHKCEARGQRCKLEKNATNSIIECAELKEAGGGAVAKLKHAGCILGPLLLLVVIGVLALFVYRTNKKETEYLARINVFLEDYRALKPTRYSYADIKRITKQFKEKVGQGGFGTVFKGNLSAEVTVAVKILNTTTGDGEEFINEVNTMGRIHHVNVVRLVGFCADGYRRALVYEFLPNESLDKFIYSEAIKKALGWKKLKDIAVGTAKGIEYLHQGCQQRILHFDIKPHNVLLDGNLNPKISDFGLAKLCSKEISAVSLTAARGTVGYIAPEVVSRNFGNVSHKSDVYSFGMMLVNMVEGGKNSDAAGASSSQGYFPDWIYARLERGEVVGTGIDTAVDANIAKQLIVVGLSCIQWHPADRPSMKQVVQMLQGEGDNLTMPPNPFAPANATLMGGPTQRGKHLNTELEVISEIE